MRRRAVGVHVHDLHVVQRLGSVDKRLKQPLRSDCRAVDEDALARADVAHRFLSSDECCVPHGWNDARGILDEVGGLAQVSSVVR